MGQGTSVAEASPSRLRRITYIKLFNAVQTKNGKNALVEDEIDRIVAEMRTATATALLAPKSSRINAIDWGSRSLMKRLTSLFAHSTQVVTGGSIPASSRCFWL
jgi:hypothetical protein